MRFVGREFLREWFRLRFELGAKQCGDRQFRISLGSGLAFERPDDR
jgi:hypothetical protein